jgi:uncharacterized membrane protein
MTQENVESSVNRTSGSMVSPVNWLKEVGNSVLGLAGLAYACGFFITNIHLSTYEIYDFSLINARFIYTGSMFLLLCAAAFYAGFLIEKIIGDSSKRKSSRALNAIITWGTVSAILSLAFKSILSLVDGLEGYSRFPITYWFYPAILFFAAQIWIAKQNRGKDDIAFGPFLRLLTSSFLPLILLAVFYALIYYPLLPVSLAGGRPVPIQLLIADNSIPLIEQVAKIEGGNVSEIAYLVEQNSEVYYILIQSDQNPDLFKPVEIDKSLVVGLLHPPIKGNIPYFVLRQDSQYSLPPS